MVGSIRMQYQYKNHIKMIDINITFITTIKAVDQIMARIRQLPRHRAMPGSALPSYSTQTAKCGRYAHPGAAALPVHEEAYHANSKANASGAHCRGAHQACRQSAPGPQF